MMAHNPAPHPRSSSLGYRSSPLFNQEHHLPLSSRHIPVISVPELVGAFGIPPSTHATANTPFCSSFIRAIGSEPPWELPELKWLDAPESGSTLTQSVPALDASGLLTMSDSLKFPFDGDRWPLSLLNAGDRMAPASGDDSHYSLQSIVRSSSAMNGSPGTAKNRYANLENMGNVKELPCPSRAQATAPEWRKTSSPRPQKRPPSESPSCLTSGRSIPELSRKVRVTTAAKYARERTNSVSDFTAMTPATPCARRSEKAASKGAGSGRGTRNPPSGPAVIERNLKLRADKSSAPAAAGHNLSRSPDSKKPGATSVSDHEIHIWTERERRKKMNGMFSTLHALLPHLTAKADKSTIVDEAINYIQNLQDQMNSLIKRRSEIGPPDLTMPSSLALLQVAHNMESMDSSDMERAATKQTSESGLFGGSMKPPASSSSNTSNSSVLEGTRSFRTLCSSSVVLNCCGSDVFITVCNPKGRSGFLYRVVLIIESHGLHVLNAQISTTDGLIMYMFHAQTVDHQHFASSENLNVALQELTNSLGSSCHSAQVTK